jgi:hypothetical protein
MSRYMQIRRLVPAFISVALLGWLFSWISPQALVHAAAELEWRLLVPATVAMVLTLYLWDAVCLPTVYRVDCRRWGYWRSLHQRGLSYLGGAINYELGQAILAWGMARMQQTGVVKMLARTVVLAYHDVVVLLTIGLVGALLSDDPRVERVRPFIAIGLVGACAVALVFWVLPTEVRAKFRRNRTESLFEGWTVRRSLRLVPMRAAYFAIFIVYAGVALETCRISVDGHVVVSTIPLTLLADGLPSVSGLGTRETTLQLLLHPERPEVLLAMSLIWTTGLIGGRLVIGLAHLWGQQWFPGLAADLPPGGGPS